MSKLRSKQIGDFNSNVVWTAATSNEIPNSKDIQNTFVPEDAMVVEEFTGNVIESTTPNWQLTISNQVQNNDLDLVTVYVNGLKTNKVNNVAGFTVTLDAYKYNIEADDVVEVHYIKSHNV